MPITIDEAFLTRLANIMRDLAAQSPAASGGELPNMKLLLGHNNFYAGQQLAALLRTRGGEIQQRLDEIGKVSGNRAVELRLLLEMTNDTEDINDLTAKDFSSQLPSWSSGGGGPASGS